MFANLKNKLIEEVKASPSKFQQFANAAQAAVSSSSSTLSGSESTTTTNANENFFSITEEDTPQNSPNKPPKLPSGVARGNNTMPLPLNNGAGAIPRARKLSSSSMASDVSFRLPSYDSPALYHMHSDLDISGSEVEDSASTAKLDVITKEQLYDAYRKSLDRYHKYRCRYTDLAKKYKDLERDSTKARSVLVETQEKAIRRISELREQCTLEQQAKAHLEEALRIEMDDMQCKMQAYQTKLKLLGENPENIAAALAAQESLNALHSNTKGEFNGNATNLISLDESTGMEAAEQIAVLENQLQEKEQILKTMKEEMDRSQSTIELLKKQEEENTLLLAQTKQAIYSELENKESDVKRLTDSLKRMQNELQSATKKESQLTSQLAEHKDAKDKLKQLQTIKQEVDAKVIAAEHKLAELREQYATKEKTLITAEEKIAALTKDCEQKLQDLRQQNSQLSEMVQRYQQNEVSLAEIDNELNRTKNENDNLRVAMAESERKLQLLEVKLISNKEIAEKLKQERLADEERYNLEKSKVDDLTKQLENELIGRDSQLHKINQLESELSLLNEKRESNESDIISLLREELQREKFEMNEQLVSKEKELKSTANKISKQKKQHENQQNKLREQNEQIETLKSELNKHEQLLLTMQTQSREREVQSEIEKKDLSTQITSILQEISQMEEQMRLVQQSHAELEAEKHSLETKIETLQKHGDSDQWREQFADAEEKLRHVELKLQNAQSENSQLAERNCLLEENSNRLEKIISEQERQQVADEANGSEMRLQLETAKDALQKLNEKMSQVLDENSRMHNAQELMDHDHRSLQDKCDALEKEKLLVQDTHKCLTAELEQVKVSKLAEEVKIQQLTDILRETESKFEEEKDKAENIAKQCKELQTTREKLEFDLQSITSQLNDIRAAQCDDDKLRDLLQEKQKRIEEYQNELRTSEQTNLEEADKREQMIASLKDQINTQEKRSEELEHIREELVMLREQKESLNQELIDANARCEEKTFECNDMTEKIQELERLAIEIEVVRQELATAKDEKNILSVELEENKKLLNENLLEEKNLQNQLDAVIPIKLELENAQQELQRLKEIEQNLNAELAETRKKYNQQIVDLEAKVTASNNDVAKLHESNDAFQVEIDKVKSKHELKVQALESSLKQLTEKSEQLQLQVSSSSDINEKLRNYEQMQVENEYLNKHAEQLGSKLEQQKQETLVKSNDVDDLKEKLKSLQCELYVFKEYAEKHDSQMQERHQEIKLAQTELQELNRALETERVELMRQTEHSKYIIEQKAQQENELLRCQQELSEVQHKLLQTGAQLEVLKESSSTDAATKDEQIEHLRSESERSRQKIETLNKQVNEITNELQASEKLQDELDALKIELRDRVSAYEVAQSSANPHDLAKTTLSDAEHLRKINETLQRELEELKQKSNVEIANLQQEIEDAQSNGKHMSERIRELELLRAGLQAQQLLIPDSTKIGVPLNALAEMGGQMKLEKEELEVKLKDIMHEVQDVSNRNLFLEQKCENYLILEQSNERLKLQNSKLSRQLDETLVSMQHSDAISPNTEFEYLKNIMFQYLTGSASGNNETLVKVISAVLKFSPQQTQVALEKEHQRRSLINKIL